MAYKPYKMKGHSLPGPNQRKSPAKQKQATLTSVSDSLQKEDIIKMYKLLDSNDATLHLLHVPESLMYAATLVWGLGAVNAEASNAEREKLGNELLEQAAKSARRYVEIPKEGSKHLN